MNKKDIFFYALIVSGVVIVFPLVLYIFHFYDGYGFSNSQESWGLFGDYYGGLLNPLLSFMTFIVVIWTLKNQKKEFEIIRQESRDNRIESQLQGFESIFFSYLKNLIDLINSFQLPRQFSSPLHDPTMVINPGREELFKLIIEAMDEYRKNAETRLEDLLPEGRLKIYFKTVKNIVKYVVSTPHVEESKKMFYFEIVKSQFSSSEIEYLSKLIKLTDSALYQYLSHIEFFKDEFNFNSKVN